jgi:gliding motility-associated-like protein
MKADKPFGYEEKKWTTISGSGVFEKDTLYNTGVSKLGVSNTFLWTVINGPCISTDEVTITVEEIKIPNGFSPNNDGTNDYFEVLGLNLDTQEAELSISNSAGTEVFFTTNKNGNDWGAWDGRNSNGVDLPEGTYYFTLKRFLKITQENKINRGYVLLKRK